MNTLKGLVKPPATPSRYPRTTSRFGASRAYQALVQERLAELREAPIPGVQTLGEFLNRRFRP
ncbi:DUF3422 family protein, partial [Thermus scotoductus]